MWRRGAQTELDCVFHWTVGISRFEHPVYTNNYIVNVWTPVFCFQTFRGLHALLQLREISITIDGIAFCLNVQVKFVDMSSFIDIRAPICDSRLPIRIYRVRVSPITFLCQ